MFSFLQNTIPFDLAFPAMQARTSVRKLAHNKRFENKLSGSIVPVFESNERELLSLN